MYEENGLLYEKITVFFYLPFFIILKGFMSK